MAAISDREALAYLLEQVLQADADAPVTLALERAGVRTASDLMSLEVSQDMPLKYDHPAEGSEKARKNVPLLLAEMCQIKGLKDYIRYHMTNVANKYEVNCVTEVGSQLDGYIMHTTKFSVSTYGIS